MARRGNPQIAIRLPQPQIDRLKAIAAEKGISLSRMLRMAIQLYLLQEGGYTQK